MSTNNLVLQSFHALTKTGNDKFTQSVRRISCSGDIDWNRVSRSYYQLDQIEDRLECLLADDVNALGETRVSNRHLEVVDCASKPLPDYDLIVESPVAE